MAIMGAHVAEAKVPTILIEQNMNECVPPMSTEGNNSRFSGREGLGGLWRRHSSHHRLRRRAVIQHRVVFETQTSSTCLHLVDFKLD
jgi:hypothetical protein